jgi:hypothetical protein
MIKTRFLSEPLSAYASKTIIAPERVGEISDDRSAVVGRDGWCFIYEGSNNYRDAYHDTELASLGDEWAKLIEQRQRVCDSLGIKFLQLVVPNKATLMPENFPEPLGAGITIIFQRLLEAAPNANLICPVENMRKPGVRDALFRCNDSHLTVAGNVLLAELMLDAVGISPVDVPCVEIIKINHVGDLGSKFQVPVVESFFAPQFEVGLLDRSKIEKTHEIILDGFNGIQQYFHNPSAPIKQTLLVFGNSFFERTPSWGISPFMASLFKSFHFIWTPDFDIELITNLQPDIIIGQTCERFLNKLPKI